MASLIGFTGCSVLLACPNGLLHCSLLLLDISLLCSSYCVLGQRSWTLQLNKMIAFCFFFQSVTDNVHLKSLLLSTLKCLKVFRCSSCSQPQWGSMGLRLNQWNHHASSVEFCHYVVRWMFGQESIYFILNLSICTRIYWVMCMIFNCYCLKCSSYEKRGFLGIRTNIELPKLTILTLILAIPSS